LPPSDHLVWRTARVSNPHAGAETTPACESRCGLPRSRKPDRAAPVAQQIETHEQLRELRQAVQKLPHMQQAALIMRKYQGLSYKEIGAALDCSAESARANVYQALKKLRRTFSQEVHNAR
jgi:RNA polymerase sigma factor (sigma-70 family)